MKTRVFVSSSNLSLYVAKEVARQLRSELIEVTVWSDEFPAGESHLESLIRIAEQVDFAIFVFADDDRIESSSKKPKVTQETTRVTRDNVVLEFGLFIGALGKDRCFALVAQVDQAESGSSASAPSSNRLAVKLPTDFQGQNYLAYDKNIANSKELSSVLETACVRIREEIMIRRGRGRNEFKAFFGDTKNATIIMPEIVAGEIKKRNPKPTLISLGTRVHNLSPRESYRVFWWFAKKSKKPGNQWKLNPSKVKRVVPLLHVDDQYAANAITELLSRYSVDVAMSTDGSERDSVHLPSTAVFSIGLMNGCSLNIAKTISTETSGSFSIQSSIGEESKNPEPKGHSASIVLDGVEFKLKNKRDTPHYAVIGRVIRRTDTTIASPEFLIGGIASVGTAVAGLFIRHEWRHILREYEKNEFDVSTDGFVAILQYDGDKPGLAKPTTVRICFFSPTRARKTIVFYPTQ